MRFGDSTPFFDVEYDRKISLVNSFNSILEFDDRHFSLSQSLAERNIKAEVATEEDYVLMAMINMYLFDNELKNKEALDLIAKAKSLDIYPSINIFKQESIALIRLNKLSEAKESLINYKEALIKEEQNLTSIMEGKEWLSTYNYLNSEREWTAKMINKVNKL